MAAAATDARDFRAMTGKPQPQQVSLELECIECGARSDEATGWKAYVDEDDGVVTYCAYCAWREFGRS